MGNLYGLIPASERRSMILALMDNGEATLTWECGDVVYFDIGATSIQMGMIVEMDCNGQGLMDFEIAIQQPSGRIRKRRLIHDFEKGSLVKMDEAEAKFARKIFIDKDK
ncbi:hypothetical protein LJC33_00975 [Eubacteriales bacterium OttesenSCG-928-N13]|nr:hypothetical protein [Eubacteriales bacterium OttesenSCG-928-N13]